jgi:proteasome lid subunit RPN8/RPN11
MSSDSSRLGSNGPAFQHQALRSSLPNFKLPIQNRQSKIPVPLHLSPSHLQTIIVHAEHAYPEECCGLLLGKMTADGHWVMQVRSLDNAWTAADFITDPVSAAAPKTRRYAIAPADMLRVMREARSQGQDIIGIYHSHPDHPSVPSECDRQQAWQGYAYLIVSVPQGRAQTWQNWTLDPDHQFQADPIVRTA